MLVTGYPPVDAIYVSSPGDPTPFEIAAAKRPCDARTRPVRFPRAAEPLSRASRDRRGCAAAQQSATPHLDTSAPCHGCCRHDVSSRGPVSTRARARVLVGGLIVELRLGPAGAAMVVLLRRPVRVRGTDTALRQQLLQLRGQLRAARRRSWLLRRKPRERRQVRRALVVPVLPSRRGVPRAGPIEHVCGERRELPALAAVRAGYRANVIPGERASPTRYFDRRQTPCLLA